MPKSSHLGRDLLPFLRGEQRLCLCLKLCIKTSRTFQHGSTLAKTVSNTHVLVGSSDAALKRRQWSGSSNLPLPPLFPSCQIVNSTRRRAINSTSKLISVASKEDEDLDSPLPELHVTTKVSRTHCESASLTLRLGRLTRLPARLSPQI